MQQSLVISPHESTINLVALLENNHRNEYMQTIRFSISNSHSPSPLFTHVNSNGMKNAHFISYVEFSVLYTTEMFTFATVVCTVLRPCTSV